MGAVAESARAQHWMAVGLCARLTCDCPASDELLKQLREKARMLGTGTVGVHKIEAGFTRFGTVAPIG